MATNDTLPAQIRDGDGWFLGFASRLDPGNLPEKMLQSSQNMRLQRGTATIRKGAKRLTGFYQDTDFGQLSAVINYTDPANGTEYILMVSTDRMFLCFENGQTYKEITFVYSANSLANHAYPIILQGEEVQAIQALDKVYILRGAASRDPSSVTFTNTAINNNTWGTFSVNNFPFRRWTSIPYTYNSVNQTVTLTIPNSNGFKIGDRLQFVSPFNNDVIAEITNTTTVIKWTSAPIPASGTISFMLWSDVYYTEFIVQSTSEPHFNGTYAPINPADIILSGTLQFYYYNNTGSTLPAHTNQNGMTVVQAKSPIVWDGVSTTASPVNQTNVTTGTTAKIPPADFGIYFQNRLIVKTSPHYIAASDILSDTFDMQLNNFNINVGSGDDIVGFLPWIESQFLVFMKRAIYVAFVETTNYISGPPGVNSSITVVTNEVGCLARRSIVNAGQFVFFLSPKGVHMLTPQLDLKLIGNTQPLSEPIADFFDGLNYTTANHACAAYYSNRFYLSVPWSGSTYNNRVVVYNTLNQQWESIDSFPSTMFVDEFFISSYGKERRLMAGCRIWSGWTNQNSVTTPSLSAGVALFDEVENYDQWDYDMTSDPPGNLILTPITGTIRTREYMFDSLAEKRFTRAQVQTNNSAGNRIQISANVHDPDTSEMIMDYTFESGVDSTLRQRIASRGSAIDLEIQILSGSPSIKTIQVTALTTDRPMISQE